MTDWKCKGIGVCSTCGRTQDLDQNAVCEKCDELARFEHLTPDQRQKIQDEARSLMIEACQDYGYLCDMVSHYVTLMTSSMLIDSISNDPECVAEQLGFDPLTGISVEDED